MRETARAEQPLALATNNIAVVVRHEGGEDRFTSKELYAVLYLPDCDSVVFLLSGMRSAMYPRSATEILYSFEPPKTQVLSQP